MIKSLARALPPVIILAAIPVIAQNAPPTVEWCVSSTIMYVPSGCNRATPDIPDKLIYTTAGARAEMVRQGNLLLEAGLISKAKLDSELARLKLTYAPSSKFTPFELASDVPGNYISITARPIK